MMAYRGLLNLSLLVVIIAYGLAFILAVDVLFKTTNIIMKSLAFSLILFLAYRIYTYGSWYWRRKDGQAEKTE